MLWQGFARKTSFHDPATARLIHALKSLDPNCFDRLCRTRYWEWPWAIQASCIRPGMRILEAGCGFAPLAEYFAACNVNVVAIDNDESLIAENRRAKRSPHLKSRIEFLRQDITSIAFPDNSFDRVVCISVLEHLPQSQAVDALNEFARVLRPAGLLILTVDFNFIEPSEFGSPEATNIDIRKLLQSCPSLLRMDAVEPPFYGYDSFCRERLWNDPDVMKVNTDYAVAVTSQAIALRKVGDTIKEPISADAAVAEQPLSFPPAFGRRSFAIINVEMQDSENKQRLLVKRGEKVRLSAELLLVSDSPARTKLQAVVYSKEGGKAREWPTDKRRALFDPTELSCPGYHIRSWEDKVPEDVLIGRNALKVYASAQGIGQENKRTRFLVVP